MSTPEEPREAVLTAKIAMLCQSGIGITIIALLLSLELKGFCEKFDRLRMRVRRSDRTIVWLTVTTAMVLGFYVTEMTQYAVDWTGNDAMCVTTSRPFIPLLFVIAKQFLYVFLYERAAIIHDSLLLNEVIFLLFRRSVLFAVIVIIPAAFYWSFFLVFSSRVFLPEGVCVMFAETSGPIIGFAAMDLVLSIMLLALFAYPLWRHLKRINSDHNMSDDKLYRLMKRNMILSTVITVSTCSNLSVMVGLYSYHKSDTPREEEFWQIYGLFFPSWDGLISTCAALCMSNIWMPKFLSDRLTFKSEEDVTGDAKDASKLTSNRDETTMRSFFTNVQNSKLATPVVSPVEV